jgi:hypothetical protein
MSKKLNDVIWIKNNQGYITTGNDNVGAIKDLLNSTGKGFCLAKFTQVTLHLGTGMTHACHHPSPHKIPLSEIEADPAALFNTSVLKQARSEMLSGQRPSECDYCWRVEDSGGPSDRYFKSLEPWAIEKHDEIQVSDPGGNYYPTYLEVDFSNVCNFACTYCGPEYSSKWVENLKQHGPIKLLEGTKAVQWAQGWQKDLDSLSYKNSEFNPYVDAFWKWFPEAYKKLKTYRITGGEPLLSKETFRSIDWFLANPNPELEFSINSNLCVPEKLWQQFIEKIKILVAGNYVKKFTLFTSVDGWGERAEYGRPGLDFNLFKKRYEEVIALGNIRAVIMCTYNIFSITSMGELLKWQAELKAKHNADVSFANWEKEYDFNIGGECSHTERKDKSPNHYAIVGIDIPYLRSPGYLDAHYADRELIQNYMIPTMSWMAKNISNHVWGMHQGFEQYEVEKMKRIVMEAMNFVKNHDDNHETVLVHRARFYDFVNENDRRHNRNFLQTFPEMAAFYEKCRLAKEIVVERMSV